MIIKIFLYDEWLLQSPKAEPHKASMTKIKGTLIEVESDICRTDHITYEAIKIDAFSLLESVINMMKDTSSTIPHLIIHCSQLTKLLNKITLTWI